MTGRRARPRKFRYSCCTGQNLLCRSGSRIQLANERRSRMTSAFSIMPACSATCWPLASTLGRSSYVEAVAYVAVEIVQQPDIVDVNLRASARDEVEFLLTQLDGLLEFGGYRKIQFCHKSLLAEESGSVLLSY